MEKVRATQQHIDDFKRQQAEWRRMEQERMEEENRRIMEFVARQQNMEEDRMAKIREREEAKDHLLKTVEINSFFIHPSFHSVSHAGLKYHSLLFCSSYRRRLKRRSSSVKRWSESVRSFVWRNRKRKTGVETL